MQILKNYDLREIYKVVTVKSDKDIKLLNKLNGEVIIVNLNHFIIEKDSTYSQIDLFFFIQLLKCRINTMCIATRLQYGFKDIVYSKHNVQHDYYLLSDDGFIKSARVGTEKTSKNITEAKALLVPDYYTVVK